jgi:hypothetical protein
MIIRHAIIIVAAVARPCAGFVAAPRSCAPLPRSLARQRAVVVADAADLSRSLAIIDAQQLVLSVGFLAALWFFAAPMGPFMVIEEETVYIDEDEEEEEWFRW